MSVINVATNNGTGKRVIKLRLSDNDKVNLVFNPISAGAFYAGLTDTVQSDVTEKFRTKELVASDIADAITKYNTKAEEAFRLLALPSVHAEVVKVQKAEKEAKEKEAKK